MSDRPDFAIISHEPAPYRMHVLRRIVAELPEARLHSLFTHSSVSMPWDVERQSEANAVFFPEAGMATRQHIGRGSVPLFRLIRDYLTRHRVRLTILLGYNDLTRALLIRWARRQGVPLLITGDSNVFGEGRLGYVKRTVKRAYVRWVLNCVSGLMPMGVCGRAFFRLYKDHNLPEFLFPYEPDYALFEKPDAEHEHAFTQRYSLNAGRKRLLYSGRFVPAKRVDLLIDAFARIAAHRPEWDLVLAGDGPLRNQLESRVPVSLRNRVTWTGFLQVEDTACCYRQCAVLVHPSEYEPWAVVINEAIASGLAVVASNVIGAAAELVRHGTNGLLVQPRNVESLVDALLRVTTPNAAETMRAQAPAILKQWRTAADPVAGVRQALKHFNLI